ncbi:RNA polymerase II mediator complex subunit [Didymosphaeria variabile]|uniref:Mediator of RNA polymerase II transcription subunit 12 n=1 Tax=Didymosphaeria variabile TaxID=1932322 RepID=A0A9W9CF18_9PLEO|nr:RNA polymerase II mediator complex subunit [Didymosphaeria variabile]KAJ4358537.1 RNA polymerase II mediator complex subunit [Didymosphaeria variabile]
MTSRPAQGAQDPVQHRGNAPASSAARWAAGHHGQDTAVEHDRTAGEPPTKPKPKGKPGPLDGLQTNTSEYMRAPPKGKPQLFFSVAANSGFESSEPSPTTSALPVPPRPSLSMPAEALHQRRMVPGGSGVKADPSTVKSVNQDTSASAAVLPGGKAADLFPWTGSHPEDVLSEALVKGGISNKSQIHNETNTARPSLWANLKNKSGTSTLSTLFIAVLEKRQSCSRLVAPNTFKPPPRLTLRDSTRETWLHDLANPAVGLRRLSRTIPHGITGKVLLDQCLNKNIPIPRALWLAKCVGINEMRAHKRKGQAGTITWVRGWTSSVEQFLDGVIATIGQQDWKIRITYALQLAAHLFKEHLMEEDHFMDWILNSLDSCSSERLFLWLLITCIPDFWSSLISFRRRGKRLAESLLSHAESIYTSGDETRETTVLGLLESIIARVAVHKPACLLLPDDWDRCKEVLHIFEQRRAHSKFSQLIADLDHRNRDIMHSRSLGSSSSQQSFRTLYRLLDGLDYEADISVDNLAYDCMDLFSDQKVLISAVLQWASTLYRQGLHRVYLVTRLLRKWNQIGIDVSEGILRYLPQVALDRSKEWELIFKVVSELVRSRTFSLGKYLQWLIATGSMDPAQDLHAGNAWQLRLLTEVPLSGLSEQVLNLRSTMLRGTVYSVDIEDGLILGAKEAILQQLTDLTCASNKSMRKMTLDIGRLSRTMHLDIAIWLRRQVAATVEASDSAPTKESSMFMAGSICTISSSCFETVRYYLEQFKDLSILADVVGIAATSFDSHVLSASADTLDYHFKAFKAISAFNPLFEKIVLRYTQIRAMRLPERKLLLSISALTHLTHDDSQLRQLLDYDLNRYDQRNSLAVCSPVSDTMIENVTGSDPEDEIERILSSGNSMDQHMMSRVFKKIVSYLQQRSCQGNYPSDNLLSWFCRLQNLEENTFHAIVASWLHSTLTDDEPHLLAITLPPLVISGCLSLSRFAETIRSCIRHLLPNHPSESLRVAVDGLMTLLPENVLSDLLSHQQAYQFRTKQAAFCQKQDSGLLDLIKEAFELSVINSTSQSVGSLPHVLSDDRLVGVLRHFATVDLQSVSFLLEISGPVGQSIESLPVAFIKFLKSNLELDHSYMLELVAGLDANLKNLMCEQAEQEVLTFSAFLCDVTLDDKEGNCLDELPFVHRLLDVICATGTSNARITQAALLAPLIERLSALLRLVVCQSPDLILKANHQHQAALMWNLRNLLTHPQLQAFPSTTQYIFDVSVLLSDHISEDVRKSLIGSSNIKCCSDKRCAFMYGLDPQDDGWLGLTRSLQRAVSPQRQMQASDPTQPQMQSQQQSSPAQSRRPSMQQQQHSQSQGRYPQQQQPHNLLSQQLQRMGSNGQNSSASQLQQMQQMQAAMAQQRQNTISPQLQRTPSAQSQPMKVTKSSGAKQERVDAKPVPYKLSRWEILPESGGNVSGNETAISLSLFGARKA